MWDKWITARTGRAGTGLLSGGERAKAAAKLMLGWVALLWLLEVVDVASGHSLDGLGITPRTTSELVDVVPAAFVHFGFGHVAANSVPLLVLGFLAALGGLRRFAGVCALIIVADGLGVWLVAPAHSNTAGASGLIFGLFGYLIVTGFVERRPWGVLVGLLVAAVWGTSILTGLAPTQTGISWQGHLAGLISGVAAAFVFRRRRVPPAPLTP
ncbi:rhomboid family intramembrane serine protease [Streptomyces turgidiscabies]|uniref:Peptidase, S54 family n=1 Tax=Streptomyces turgidiscabies (strain Car8) TaxID=698760 RepID=L7EYV1_STRT8|nr:MULTISPECIES: rhomboid family intramembrane serine protease [Streptomyces]ELP63916.1 peptidase, S54 family [Streptomyces turgidiscabies Car8]MDX3498656.1 rhomboid family intramembrane serine protease [Streptomyces turgidiscabies]GAQ74920.1 rhomboid family protein [Streptomyces turgidiscabies]